MQGLRSRRAGGLWVALPLVSVSVASFVGSAARAADTTPQFVRAWGKLGSGPGEFNYPTGIEVDATGNVYVADNNNNRIQVFSNTGDYLFSWGSAGNGPGQFAGPQGIAFDATGNVYVTDYQNYRVQKFTHDGQFLLTWGSGGKGDGQFGTSSTTAEGPYGIAVDANGDVYVSDEGNNRIQKFTSQGIFLTKWGSYGTGSSQFKDRIDGLATDVGGNIYVADIFNHRVQKFSGYGSYLTSLNHGPYDYPSDVAILPDGNLAELVLECGVQNFTPTGAFVSSWGVCGDSLGQFNAPYGIAVDGSGNIFIANTYSHQVQEFAGDQVPVRGVSWGAIKAVYR